MYFDRGKEGYLFISKKEAAGNTVSQSLFSIVINKNYS
jgi:hypothetical protein|tara:strand:+ start:168 stop:281 length:114 start_codon:yes stop_codon:yes gene_type:complete